MGECRADRQRTDEHADCQASTLPVPSRDELHAGWIDARQRGAGEHSQRDRFDWGSRKGHSDGCDAREHRAPSD
jgi:hypothetical protein